MMRSSIGRNKNKDAKSALSNDVNEIIYPGNNPEMKGENDQNSNSVKKRDLP